MQVFTNFDMMSNICKFLEIEEIQNLNQVSKGIKELNILTSLVKRNVEKEIKVPEGFLVSGGFLLKCIFQINDCSFENTDIDLYTSLTPEEAIQVLVPLGYVFDRLLDSNEFPVIDYQTISGVSGVTKFFLGDKKIDVISCFSKSVFYVIDNFDMCFLSNWFSGTTLKIKDINALSKRVVYDIDVGNFIEYGAHIILHSGGNYSQQVNSERVLKYLKRGIKFTANISPERPHDKSCYKINEFLEILDPDATVVHRFTKKIKTRTVEIFFDGTKYLVYRSTLLRKKSYEDYEIEEPDESEKDLFDESREIELAEELFEFQKKIVKFLY